MIHYQRLNYEMLRNSYSILFYIRKSKRDPTTGTIYVRLTLNRKTNELCCSGVQCAIKDFDTKRQRVKNQDLNAKLITLKSDIIYFIEHTPDPTVLKIRNLLSGKETINPTLIKILNDYLENNKHKNAHNTNRDWIAKIKKIEAYLKEITNENLEARRFNNVLFNQFKTWLINTQNNTENSANKYGHKIRKALSWATNQGFIITNPLAETQMPIHYEDDLTHLEWEWVVKLREHKFTGKLKKATDLYIFSCCTGICYADIMNLNDSHLEISEELGLFITNKRQKVKSVYCTPLWGYALEIYKEFKKLESIPRISNQKVNDYIKMALFQIGYPEYELITFHTGRKTFVNYCLNVKMIEPHIIITYTGHKSVKEIQAYGKVNRVNALNRFYIELN